MTESKTIAIIGASKNRNKYGNKAIRAYLDMGYTVYPVNPSETEIENLPTFKDIRDIPGPVREVSVYLPPKRTLLILDSIAEKGVETVFLNPGTEDEKVIEKANELGLSIVQACSILALGRTPSQYDE
jgi:uncharacterized protein